MDSAMNGVREAIEHHYGECALYFPFLGYKRKVKVMSKMQLEAMYFCIHLFRNLLKYLNENKTSERFKCRPSSPEIWVATG